MSPRVGCKELEGRMWGRSLETQDISIRIQNITVRDTLVVTERNLWMGVDTKEE